jgi:hypothetical protein
MSKRILTLLIAASMQLAAAAPAWFLETKADNDASYYGYGSSETKEEAIKNALSDVASKIAVTIESSFSSTQSVSGENVEKEQRNEILSNVKKMNFNNYEVLKTASDSDTDEVYVLVRVDRDQLLEEKQSELDVAHSKLSSELSTLEGISEIEKYKILRDISADVQQLYDTAMLAKSISPAFDPSRYLSFYTRYKTQLTETRSRITIMIVADDSVAKNFTKVFAAYLSKQGIKVSPTRANAKLTLSATAKERKVQSTNEAIQNAKFALITLTTTLENSSKVEIATNAFTFTNNSSSSYADALKKTQKLEKFLAEAPDQVLNFILSTQSKGD